MLDENDKQWILATLESFSTKADLERIETRPLTEFHKWASPNTKRMNSHSSDISAI